LVVESDVCDGIRVNRVLRRIHEVPTQVLAPTVDAARGPQLDGAAR